MNSTSTFTHPRILSDFLLLSLQNKELRRKSYTERSPPSSVQLPLLSSFTGDFCRPSLQDKKLSALHRYVPVSYHIVT